MFDLRRNLSENLFIFVLTSFLFTSVFGVGSMETMDGQMSSCLFVASQGTLCQMSITEHISQWQQAFFGIPTKMGLLALAVILLTIIIISFAKPVFRLEQLTEFAARLVVYHKAHLVKMFDPLLLAFSDGILNPKIYEPAQI